MGWELQERVWVEDRNEPFTVTEIWNNSKTGAGVLPVMGTVNSSFSTVYVSNRRFSYFPGGQNRACVITYKPYDSENPDPSSSFADLPRRWRINGEFISTQSDAPMYWASGAPNGDLVQQNIFRRLINQSYVITEVVTDMQIGTSNGPHGKIISKAGRVNSATWEGFGKGNWMYLGGEVDEISSSDGSTNYRIEHNFAARIIVQQTNNVSTSEGWQRIWNEADATWDQVSDSPGFNETGQLYKFSNFSNIFSAAGA